EEVDDHLLSDARNVNPAPTAPGPDLRDPHPTRAVFVEGALAIPAKLHLHPRILVGPDLLIFLPHHDRRLRAAHDRLRRAARDAEVPLRVDCAEADAEVRLRSEEHTSELQS